MYVIESGTLNSSLFALQVRGQQGGGRGRRGGEGEGSEGAVLGAALHLGKHARLLLDRPQRPLFPRQVRLVDLIESSKTLDEH